MSAAKRAEVVSLLEATRQRQNSYSFRFVTTQLKAVGFPTANGWPMLLAKAENLSVTDATHDWDAYVQEAKNVYRNARLFGSSATFLFELAPGSQQQVAGILAALVDPSSPFQQQYPHPLPASALQRSSFSPAFVAHQAKATKHLLVACSKRAYREREALIINDFSKAVRDVLQDYDEVYAIKQGFVQAFDRIFFDTAAHRAELHIDLCCPLNGEELIIIADKYRAKVNALAAKHGIDNFLQGPKNVFPKIRLFYNTKDGNVISLGHSTGTKSVKEERMRSKTLDLRTELFHKHGIEAITSTEAFSIKKGWQATGGYIPSIQIPGNYLMVGQPSPVVPYSVIEGCMKQADFQELVAKLW